MTFLARTTLIITLLSSLTSEAKLPRMNECSVEFQAMLYKTFTVNTKNVADGFKSFFLESEAFTKVHPTDAVAAIRTLENETTFYFHEDFSKKYPEVQRLLSDYRQRVDALPTLAEKTNATKSIRAQLVQWADESGSTSSDVLRKYNTAIETIIDKLSGDDLSKIIQSKDYFSKGLAPSTHGYQGAIQNDWEALATRYQKMVPSEQARFNTFATKKLYKKLVELDDQ